MEGQLISHLIQRGAGEDISSEEGWLQALGTWALLSQSIKRVRVDPDSGVSILFDIEHSPDS